MSVAGLIKTIVSEVAGALAPLIINEAKSRLKAKGLDIDEATEKLMLAELDALHAAMKGMESAFDVPTNPLGRSEGLLDGMDVEIVGQDEPVTFKEGASYVFQGGKFVEVVE